MRSGNIRAAYLSSLGFKGHQVKRSLETLLQQDVIGLFFFFILFYFICFFGLNWDAIFCFILFILYLFFTHFFFLIG